jgi:CBS domain-containing protein
MAGVAMALGFNLPVFGTGLLGGVWLALIGWFLHRAAAGSYEQLVIEHILDDVTVPEIMAHAVAIPASTTLAELVHEHLLSSDARAFPIVDEHMTLLGIVSLDDVRKVSRERWPTTRVIDAMTARERLLVADPHSRLPEILQRMLRRDVAQVPVVSDERLIGVIRRADLLRWLELQLPRPRPRRPDEYDEQRAAA